MGDGLRSLSDGTEALAQEGLDPRLKGSKLAAVAAGTGQIGGAVALGSFSGGSAGWLGYGANTARVVGNATLAVQGALGNADAVYRDAIAHGASEEQANRAGLLALPVGLSAALPVYRILGRVQNPQAVASVINTMIGEMTVAAAQGGNQQWMNNLIARRIYDAHRDEVEGVLDASLLSAASVALPRCSPPLARRPRSAGRLRGGPRRSSNHARSPSSRWDRGSMEGPGTKPACLSCAAKGRRRAELPCQSSRPNPRSEPKQKA